MLTINSYFTIYILLYPILGLIQSGSTTHTNGIVINFCDSNIINIICLHNNKTFHHLSLHLSILHLFRLTRLFHTMPCSWTVSEGNRNAHIECSQDKVSIKFRTQFYSSTSRGLLDIWSIINESHYHKLHFHFIQ